MTEEEKKTEVRKDDNTVYVGKKGAKSMFNWAKKNHTKVVITREHFMPFAYYDLRKAGYKETEKTPAHIKAAISSMPPVKPKMSEQK